MATYKKFLIKQQTYNGVSYTDVGDVVDTQSTFGVVCQECPFKILPESKELPTGQWYDEDGEDVFIPLDGLRFEAYDMEAKFLYAGNKSNIASDLKSFIDFIYGRVNIVNGQKVAINPTKNVALAVYDEYTEVGRRGVYVKSVDDDIFLYDDSDTEAVGIFKVKFRVTDPVTDVTLTVAGGGSSSS